MKIHDKFKTSKKISCENRSFFTIQPESQLKNFKKNYNFYLLLINDLKFFFEKSLKKVVKIFGGN